MAFFRRYELVLGFLLGLAVCVVAIVYSENYKTDNQSYQTTNRHGGALSAEERIANYTWWLGLFTLVLAASTIGLWIVTWRAGVRQSRDMEAAIAVAARSADAATQSADAAKKSAEVAERTLVHSERPWIAIYPEIVGELIFDTETVDTIIKITIKNVGNSPAMNVSYNHKMFVNITDAIMYARIEAEKVHTLWAGFGRVLFPQEEFSENWFVSISREEFLESVAKYVAENRLPSPAFGVFAYYTFPAAPDGFRHTTLLVEMRQKDRTFAGFDGSERGFDPKALELAQTITGGEVS